MIKRSFKRIRVAITVNTKLKAKEREEVKMAWRLRVTNWWFIWRQRRKFPHHDVIDFHSSNTLNDISTHWYTDGTSLLLFPRVLGVNTSYKKTFPTETPTPASSPIPSPTVQHWILDHFWSITMETFTSWEWLCQEKRMRVYGPFSATEGQKTMHF